MAVMIAGGGIDGLQNYTWDNGQVYLTYRLLTVEISTQCPPNDAPCRSFPRHLSCTAEGLSIGTQHYGSKGYCI